MSIERVDVGEASERIVELERQVANLKQAMDSRQRIGVSVGLLAHQLDCDPDEAWKSLARLSQNTNTRAGTIARVLVDLHCHRVSAADAELADTLQQLLSPRRRVRAIGVESPTADVPERVPVDFPERGPALVRA